MLQLSQTLSLGDEANGIVRVYPLPFAISAFLRVPEAPLAFTLHRRRMKCSDGRGGSAWRWGGGGGCGARRKGQHPQAGRAHPTPRPRAQHEKETRSVRLRSPRRFFFLLLKAESKPDEPRPD